MRGRLCITDLCVGRFWRSGLRRPRHVGGGEHAVVDTLAPGNKPPRTWLLDERERACACPVSTLPAFLTTGQTCLLTWAGATRALVTIPGRIQPDGNRDGESQWASTAQRSSSLLLAPGVGRAAAHRKGRSHRWSVDGACMGAPMAAGRRRVVVARVSSRASVVRSVVCAQLSYAVRRSRPRIRSTGESQTREFSAR